MASRGSAFNRSDRVQHVRNTADFDAAISRAGKKLVVIKFGAEWCAPCKRMAPVFQELSAEFSRSVFLECDTDEAKELAKASGVEAIPTFMFFQAGAKLAEETLRGAEPEKLREAVARLDKQFSPFSSQGFSLQGDGGGGAAAAAAAAGASSSSSAAAASSGPQRRNPWANPDWVPPGLRKAEPEPVAAPPAAASAAAAASSSAAAASSSPWANPDFVPNTNFPDPSPGAAAALDAAGAAIGAATDAAAAAAAAAPDAAAAAASPGGGDSKNPAELLRGIDGGILAQLLGMGFPQTRAEKALILNKRATVDSAIGWLMDHADDADIDEPLQVVGVQDVAAGDTGGVASGHVIDPTARGAPLGYKAGDAYDDPDAKTGLALVKDLRQRQQETDSSGVPKTKEERELEAALAVKPPPGQTRTLEEKEERMKQRRRLKQLQKSREDVDQSKNRELKRRVDTRAMAETKRKREAEKLRLVIEKEKREKRREKERRQKIKDKIKAEREAKKKQLELSRRAREQQQQ